STLSTLLSYIHLPRSTLLFLFLTRRPPSSPLFPYTTLFRSPIRRPTMRPVSRVIPLLAALLACRPAAPAAPPDTSAAAKQAIDRSEEHTSELQSPDHLVCRLLLEKKKNNITIKHNLTQKDTT